MRTVLLAMVLSGCAAGPRQLTQIQGRWVETTVRGRGAPVVVFESGLGADVSAWDQVLPEVAAFATAFAYSRPGLGHSERTETPRTGRVVIEELRATLRSRGLAPPYVLVGHSLGGLYLQLFARRYPQEVAALVLLDSSHPAQLAGARGRPPRTWWTTLLNLYMTGTRGREFRGLNGTGEEVLATPTYEGPVFVLNAGKPPSEPIDAQARLRVDLAALYPRSELRWIDSTHDIPRRHPRAVIELVREAVERAR